MQTYKSAVAAKVAQLVAAGWKVELATQRARKVCRHLHPSHRAAVARRIEAADVAIEVTGKFHTI